MNYWKGQIILIEIQDLEKKQKENLLKWLIEKFKSLAKKEQYMLNNYDDVQYQGISDIKHTLNAININRHDKPELIASAFGKHYERYRINGDKNKELPLSEYRNTVRLNVQELITKKNIGQWNVQLLLSIIFINYNNDTAEKYTYSQNITLIMIWIW